MTITSVDLLVVVCMGVGFSPVIFALFVFFCRMALVDFLGEDNFLLAAKLGKQEESLPIGW